MAATSKQIRNAVKTCAEYERGNVTVGTRMAIIRCTYETLEAKLGPNYAGSRRGDNRVSDAIERGAATAARRLGWRREADIRRGARSVKR